MESIGELLSKRPDVRGNFDKLVAEVMKNEQVQAFISENQMSEDEVQRSYSKFYEFVKERKKFEEHEKRAADGYEPVLIMNHGYADVISSFLKNRLQIVKTGPKPMDVRY